MSLHLWMALNSRPSATTSLPRHSTLITARAAQRQTRSCNVHLLSRPRLLVSSISRVSSARRHACRGMASTFHVFRGRDVATVLVDGGLVEVFLNGLVTITALVNPDPTRGTATQVCSRRGTFGTPNLTACPLFLSYFQRSNFFNNSALPASACSVNSWQMASVQAPSERHRQHS